MTSKIPKAPAVPPGLAASGRKLWQSVTQEFDLEEYEKLLLLQASRCADHLDRLAEEAAAGSVTVTSRQGIEVASPSMIEGRQQSLVLARLLASLRLPY